MNVSKINLINFTSSKKEIDIPSWVNEGHNKKPARQSRPSRDEFTSSRRPRSRKRRKQFLPAKFIAMLVATIGIGSQAPKVINHFVQDDKNITTDKNSNENFDLSTIANTVNETQDIYIEIPSIETGETTAGIPFEDGIPNVPKEYVDGEIIDDENIVNAIYYGEIKSDLDIKAQKLLENIYEQDEYAKEHLENFRESFSYEKSENDIAKMLINLCESSQWGDNCIDPLTFYAQICQESNCETDALGDFSKKSQQYLAVGFGQCHECAVDEVNEHIKKGTFGPFEYNNGAQYKYSDRSNPKKGLEIMILYLRYCSNRTNSTKAMLAMYNRGTKNGINTPEGKEYVRAVYSQLGE